MSPEPRPRTNAPRRGGRASPWILCAIASLAGCDPAEPRKAALPPAVPEPFRVLALEEVSGPRSDRRHGNATAVRVLEVRFPAALDVGSVGRRSVRVEGGTSRRPLRATAVADADVLRVLVPAHEAADEETLRVVLEGEPSPRAIRAADGRALRSRYEAVLPGGPGRGDLVGPRLLDSVPADGAVDASPAATVELRFDEALGAGPAPRDAVVLTVDGREIAARVRTSADGHRLLVRPAEPVGPGAQVEVALRRWIADRAGNPLRDDSPRLVRFRTRNSSLHEIREDFVCDDMADPAATDAAWGEVEAPGWLVPRAGTVCALDTGTPPETDLGDRRTARFQALLRPEDRGGPTLVSGLRIRLASLGEPTGAVVPDGGAMPWSAGGIDAIRVEGCATDLEDLLPCFEDNRADAPPVLLALAGGPGEGGLPAEPDAGGGATADVPFAEPLLLAPGRAVLVDVTVTLAPGARLAAERDTERTALVDGGGRERLRPQAALVTSAGEPSARSRWYDAGTGRPSWRRAVVTTSSPASDASSGEPDPADGGTTEGVRVRTEFQAAPDDGAGRPDTRSATEWTDDLTALPPWRHVRFRVTFEGVVPGRPAPSVDAITLPFVRSGR